MFPLHRLPIPVVNLIAGYVASVDMPVDLSLAPNFDLSQVCAPDFSLEKQIQKVLNASRQLSSMSLICKAIKGDLHNENHGILRKYKQLHEALLKEDIHLFDTFKRQYALYYDINSYYFVMRNRYQELGTPKRVSSVATAIYMGALKAANSICHGSGEYLQRFTKYKEQYAIDKAPLDIIDEHLCALQKKLVPSTGPLPGGSKCLLARDTKVPVKFLEYLISLQLAVKSPESSLYDGIIRDFHSCEFEVMMLDVGEQAHVKQRHMQQIKDEDPKRYEEVIALCEKFDLIID